MNLRPHHGMCLAFFEGKGYSQGFTAHMQTVLDGMVKNPVLTLVTRGDVVCGRCPNLTDGICITAEKVERYDRRVLEACGLSEGVFLPWSEFSALVSEHILAAGKREEICGDCEWNGICKRREETPNF